MDTAGTATSTAAGTAATPALVALASPPIVVRTPTRGGGRGRVYPSDNAPDTPNSPAAEVAISGGSVRGRPISSLSQGFPSPQAAGQTSTATHQPLALAVTTTALPTSDGGGDTGAPTTPQRQISNVSSTSGGGDTSHSHSQDRDSRGLSANTPPHGQQSHTPTSRSSRFSASIGGLFTRMGSRGSSGSGKAQGSSL